MGFETHSAILCKKCNMRSDAIEHRKGTRIQNINIFNIMGFIEKHSLCFPLKIDEIANYVSDPDPIPNSNYIKYIEDLDIIFDRTKYYEANPHIFIEELNSHKDRYNKNQAVNKELKF